MLCKREFNNWTDFGMRLKFGKYGNTTYDLEYKKVCLDSTIPQWDPSTIILITIAIFTVYFSTQMPPLTDENNVAVEEELEWYHVIYFVAFGSIFLTIIFFFATSVEKFMTILFFPISILILYLCSEQIILSLNKVTKWACEAQAMDLTRIGIGKISVYELAAFLISVFLTLIYYISDYWVINNMIGVGYVFQAIRMITVKKMYVVIFLLSFMFLFDIYWVFYSVKQFGASVMMIAATHLNVPIKIVWPHIFATPVRKCSLLGLGDMAIPAFAIKFYSYADTKLKTGKFYHTIAIVGYAIALITCIIVLSVFKSGQPAL